MRVDELQAGGRVMTDEKLGMNYYADVDLRKSRSEGYAAGYDKRPRTTDLLTAEQVVAWNEGYDAAIALMAGPVQKQEVHVAEVQSQPASESELRMLPGNGEGRLDGDLSRDTGAAAEADSEGGLCDRSQCGEPIPLQGVGAQQPTGGVGETRPSNERDVRERAAVPSDFQRCGVVALIDLSNLLRRAFHATHSKTSQLPVKGDAVRSMFSTLERVLENMKPEYIVFCLDGGYRDRTAIYPQYKAHREETPPEYKTEVALAEAALDALGWPAIRVIDWEADDVIGALAKQLAEISLGTVIVSKDKDLIQLMPVNGVSIYHPWDQGSMFTLLDCEKQFGVRPGQMRDYLSLVGDSTDGIPGVAGVGEKTAAKLLSEYKSLDGVLAAAAGGAVPGAIGKKLREQAPAARLSQQLVTLRTDLPVGFHWSDWPLDKPRAGWKQKLESMGLGFTAARLAKRLPVGVDRGDKPSHMDIEWSGVGFDQAGGEFTAEPLPVADPASAVVSDPPKPVTGPNPTVIDPSDVSGWYPGLHACPPDASLLDKVRAVYRTGLDHFQNNRQVENSWKRESPYFAAFDDGYHGRPLSIDLADYTADGSPIGDVTPLAKPEPAPAPAAVSPDRPVKRTLF